MANHSGMFQSLLSFILLFLYSSGIPKAQISSFSTDDIIQRHVKAMGGVDRWRALHTYTLHQTRTDGSQVICYAQKPNKFSIIRLNGDVRRIKAFDGKVGFLFDGENYSPMRPGEEIEMAEEPGFYDELVLNNGKYPLFQKPDTTIEERACHVLQLIKSERDTQTYWIDKNTYLIAMTGEYSEDPAHTGIFYRTLFSDFREVDGYLFPFHLKLIGKNDRVFNLIYDKIDVNPVIPITAFTFEPNSVRSFYDYVKHQFPKKEYPGFTFEQETIFYDSIGQATDTTWWFEAISYPRSFRIQLGHDTIGNANIWRNDSLFVFRNNNLVHRRSEFQTSLLAKNGFFRYETDEIIERLTAANIDTSTFRKDQYEGREIFVIGGKKGDIESPQIWYDKEHLYVVRRIDKLGNGSTIELCYHDYKLHDEKWIEGTVDINIDHKLYQYEIYHNIQTPDSIPQHYFELKPYTLNK